MTKVYYTKDHEWISLKDNVATIGITRYAQEQLGDLVFVELPEIGVEIKQGDSVAVVESVKAASEVYAPISGRIIKVNVELESKPSLVNSSPELEGWLWKMAIDNEEDMSELLDEHTYKNIV